MVALIVASAESSAELSPPQNVPTTAGPIAVANLEGQLRAVGGRAVEAPATRIELLLTRGAFLGRVADLAHASELAEALPPTMAVWLLRARTRSALHRFAAALVALDEAEQLGAGQRETRPQRASVLQALGELDSALALRRLDVAASPTTATLGAEAAVLADMGLWDAAHARFAEAARRFRDVSPFPIVWLLVQEGAMWARAGESARAERFYRDAIARLPVYTHAVLHLARVCRLAEGIALLRPLLATSDDPEVPLLLAQLLRRDGRVAEAAPLHAQAQIGYAALLERFPEAFAEHVAQLRLDEGPDARKAYQLALQNLALRGTDQAFQLAGLSGLTAGSAKEACIILGVGAARPFASEALRTLHASCPRADGGPSP